MPSPSLKLLVLKTPEVECVHRFYSRLGFQFVEERHGNGPVHFSAKFGDGILEIYPLPLSREVESTIRLGISVTDIDSVLELLRDTAEIISNPTVTQWGMRAVVRDPDGRIVELYEST